MSFAVRRARAVFALSLLFTASSLAAPPALAQTDATTPAPKKPKKKKPKPPPVDEAPADAPPTPAPEPPPAEPVPAPAPATEPPAAAPPESAEAPITDVFEKDAKTYYFVGVRYRGTIIPKFMMNLFVNEGATVYSNTIGLEMDIRRDDFSMIPWIVYTSYATGDILFWQKNQPETAGYFSDVKSNLQAVYVGADLLWSKRISNHFTFEYGAGFGLGFLFGNLYNDWVNDDPNGTLVSSDGHHYTACAAADNGATSGCNPNNHTNKTPVKVGGYVEPNWFGGGSVPVVFPHIAIPELGIRYKPIKQLETRLVIGFSLTGFFFGLSGDYGLEKPDRPEKATSN
jgi:hypothetical protein